MTCLAYGTIGFCLGVAMCAVAAVLLAVTSRPPDVTIYHKGGTHGE